MNMPYKGAICKRLNRNSSSRVDPVARAAGVPTKLASCANCRKQFQPLRRTAKFCGDSCRQAAHRGRSYRDKCDFPSLPDAAGGSVREKPTAGHFSENAPLALQKTSAATKTCDRPILGRGWQAPRDIIDALLPSGITQLQPGVLVRWAIRADGLQSGPASRSSAGGRCTYHSGRI